MHMLLSNAGFRPYTDISQRRIKLTDQALFWQVKRTCKAENFVSHLVCIMFPEPKKLIPILHTPHTFSVYALQEEFLSTNQVAVAHLTRLKAFLKLSPKAAANETLSWESEMFPKTPLRLGHPLSPIDYSISPASSVNWIPRLLKLRNKFNLL